MVVEVVVVVVVIVVRSFLPISVSKIDFNYVYSDQFLSMGLIVSYLTDKQSHLNRLDNLFLCHKHRLQEYSLH